jgi:phosphoribosyl 1,2-cyclic phosphodiesterase
VDIVVTVRVTFYGVRGSCPCSGPGYATFGGATSCVLVEDGSDVPIILDAGTGMRQLGSDLGPGLVERGIPLHARVLLTHLHYDHLLGLPFFSPLEDPGAVVEIYGPRQGETSLADLINGAVTPPFFPVQIKEFAGDVRLIEVADEDFAAGAAKVTARRISHTDVALGFRVEVDGSSIVYMPDHQAPLDRTSIEEPALELCRGADVLIHDAQYDEEEFARRSDWGHSTVAYAVRVAAESQVGRLVLFHHDPSHDDERLMELEAMAQSLPEAADLDEVVAAREGMTITL